MMLVKKVLPCTETCRKKNPPVFRVVECLKKLISIRCSAPPFWNTKKSLICFWSVRFLDVLPYFIKPSTDRTTVFFFSNKKFGTFLTSIILVYQGGFFRHKIKFQIVFWFRSQNNFFIEKSPKLKKMPQKGSFFYILVTKMQMTTSSS